MNTYEVIRQRLQEVGPEYMNIHEKRFLLDVAEAAQAVASQRYAYNYTGQGVDPAIRRLCDALERPLFPHLPPLAPVLGADCPKHAVSFGQVAREVVPEAQASAEAPHA